MSRNKKIVEQIIRTLDSADELNVDRVLLYIHALNDESVADDFMNKFRKKGDSCA